MRIVVQKAKIATDTKDGRKRCYLEDKSGNGFWCYDEALIPTLVSEKAVLADVKETPLEKGGVKRKIVKLYYNEDPRAKLVREKSESIAKSVALDKAVEIVIASYLSSDARKDTDTTVLVNLILAIAKRFNNEFLWPPIEDIDIPASVLENGTSVATVEETKSVPVVLSPVPAAKEEKASPAPGGVAEEPVAPAPVKKPDETKPQKKPLKEGEEYCEECGDVCPVEVVRFSRKFYKKIYCMKCQSKLKKAGKIK